MFVIQMVIEKLLCFQGVMKKYSFSEAMNQALIDTQKPVITDFDLSVIIAKLLTSRTYNDVQMRLRQGVINLESIKRRVKSLERDRIIAPDPDFSIKRGSAKIRFGANVWWISGAPRGSAEDVCCLTDPFCFISHLSAMQRYGLTERNPKNLVISTYKRQVWNAMRDSYLADEQGDAILSELRLTKISIPLKIRGRNLDTHISSHEKIIINVPDTFFRMSDIGTTFADMLERPALCGGMGHVLNVWENEAELHLDEIIQAVNRCTKKIVKVRAGYILNERMGLTDQRVQAWLQFATRGGDQKLDPHELYDPVYSEKWMISINV